MVPEVDAVGLATELKGPNPPRLLDVREADELEVSQLDGIVHIPMGELAERLSELDRDSDWVVVCRTGGRSGRVTEALLANGFTRVRNLAGGMNGWARAVDPSVAVY